MTTLAAFNLIYTTDIIITNDGQQKNNANLKRLKSDVYTKRPKRIHPFPSSLWCRKKTTKSGQHSKRVLDRGGNTATTSKWRWNVRGGQWWLLMMILKMFIIMTIISIVLGTNYNTLSSEQKTKTKQLQELMPPKEVWLGSIVWRRIFFVFSAIFFLWLGNCVIICKKKHISYCCCWGCSLFYCYFPEVVRGYPASIINYRQN